MIYFTYFRFTYLSFITSVFSGILEQYFLCDVITVCDVILTYIRSSPPLREPLINFNCN